MSKSLPIPDFRQFCELISRNLSVPVEKLQYTTLICSDLRVAGDDVSDLLDELKNNYGTDFSHFPYAAVAGAEGGFNPFSYIFSKLAGKPPMSEITDVSLGELYCAVQNRAWNPSAGVTRMPSRE